MAYLCILKVLGNILIFLGIRKVFKGYYSKLDSTALNQKGFLIKSISKVITTFFGKFF